MNVGPHSRRLHTHAPVRSGSGGGGIGDHVDGGVGMYDGERVVSEVVSVMVARWRWLVELRRCTVAGVVR